MQASDPTRRTWYVFYFDTALEGEQVLARVLELKLPHRLQKFHSTAYAGAISLGRGWGRIYVPDFALEEFMRATNNQLAPEPELHIEEAAADRDARGVGWWRAFRRWLARPST